MKCNNCGKEFNEANLAEVFEHEHKGIEAPKIKGKRIIKQQVKIIDHLQLNTLKIIQHN